MSNFVKFWQFRPSFTIILGNFNARSKSWWPEDVISHEGTHIESLTTMHGLQHLSHLLQHLLQHLRPSTFASQIFIMYWPYFYRPTQLSCQQWCSSIIYNGKKIPLIPPLLINDKLESDYGKRENHLMSILHQGVLHWTKEVL